MIRFIILLGILVFVSCSKKDSNYWIKPENQDSNLNGFYASEDYCELLSQNCPEHSELTKISELIGTLWSNRIQDSTFNTLDSLTKNTLNNLEELHEVIVEVCGGYCTNTGFSLPILPYRTKDLTLFWSDENISKLTLLLNSHIEELERKSLHDLSDKIISNDSARTLFLNKNTIGAMIEIRKLQLEIVHLNEQLKSR